MIRVVLEAVLLTTASCMTLAMWGYVHYQQWITGQMVNRDGHISLTCITVGCGILLGLDVILIVLTTR